MEWWIRMLRHLVGRNCVGWFNLAAETLVESMKPTGFILPTIDIEFTRCILPTIRKPFCDTHRIYQACLSYGHTEPNKLLFQWYISNLQSTIKRCRYDWDIFTFLEPNCGPIYVFTKKTPIPTLGFRAKWADELAEELWPVNLHKKPSVWPCWLRIAQFFLVGLVMYIRSLSIEPWEVLSMGLSTRTVWFYQLPRAIRFT